MSGECDNAIRSYAVLTLALDTSTRAGSVAVLRDDEVLAIVHGDSARTHGERLPDELDRALKNAGVTGSALDLLAVASGPGGFTGLRIGLAAIQGCAMVWAVPTIGVSALDALADAVDEADVPPGAGVATWMDAFRGEVFAAYYPPVGAGRSRWEGGTAPMVGPPDAILRQSPETRRGVFIGDGAVRYRTEIARERTDVQILEAPALAPFVARIARVRAARGEAGPPHALQPLYVRRSDAELARGSKAAGR